MIQDIEISLRDLADAGTFVSGFATVGALAVGLGMAWHALREFRCKLAIDAYAAYRNYADPKLTPDSYKKVAEAVRSPDPVQELRKICPNDRRLFLGHSEELALLLNSGIVRPEVAYHAFATTVLAAHDHPKELWAGIYPPENDHRWSLARDLRDRFREIAKYPSYSRASVRF
jgi:hypothetical protein